MAQSLHQVVHIGQRKTATTWLQVILIAAADRTRTFDLVHGDARPWTKANIDKPDDEVAWTDLIDLLSRWRERDVFVSMENLIVFDHRRMANAIAEALPAAKILVTTRAPAPFLRSAYAHAVLTGRDIGPKFFAKRTAKSVMSRSHDLVSVSKACSSAFGTDNVFFLPFELLRDNQPAYLDAVSNLFGMALGEYAAEVPRKVAPPEFFLAAVQRENERVQRTDPEWAKSDERRVFLRMCADAVSAARDLWSIFERRAQTAGLSYEPPELPEALLPRFKTMQACLLDLPIYRPYLADYGLTD